MLRLRDIMTIDVVSLSPETTIREAMELLARRHLSGAPVVSCGKVIGVISATDLMAFAGSLSGIPTDSGDADDSWEQWSDPPTASSADNDEGGEPPSAFFSQMWEDAGADVTARMANAHGPEWNALEEHVVSEAMTFTPLVALSPDSDVAAAAAIMSERGIHRVLVTDAGGALAGIVTTLDITRAAADHRLTTRTYVFNHEARFDDGTDGR